MSAPAWALSLAYWLHMLATIVWIGGLASMSILVIPAARRALDTRQYAMLLGALQARLEPLGWFSIILLVGTGMLQMSASPNYQGFLEIQNRWAAAILLKHILFFLMLGISAYLTWGLFPKLRRLALQQARGLENPAALEIQSKLLRQESRLVWANLTLGVLVLLLTAIARAS